MVAPYAAHLGACVPYCTPRGCVFFDCLWLCARTGVQA